MSRQNSNLSVEPIVYSLIIFENRIQYDYVLYLFILIFEQKYINKKIMAFLIDIVTKIILDFTTGRRAKVLGGRVWSILALTLIKPAIYIAG